VCRSREDSKEEHFSIRCSARIRDDNPTGGGHAMVDCPRYIWVYFVFSDLDLGQNNFVFTQFWAYRTAYLATVDPPRPVPGRGNHALILDSVRRRPRRHRRERKASRAILELRDANFAEVFGVILMFQDQGLLSQNLRFELYTKVKASYRQ